MIDYVLRRIVYMVVVLVIISICAFVIIQLPPGDYLTDYLARLQSRSTGIDEAMIEALRRQYGLDLPAHLQYLRWVGKMVRGDFGQSFSFEEPVSVLLMAAPADDGAHFAALPGVRVHRLHPHRHLLRHPPVFPHRLRHYGDRVHRPGRPPTSCWRWS